MSNAVKAVIAGGLVLIIVTLTLWSVWGRGIRGVIWFPLNLIVLALCTGPGVGFLVHYAARKRNARLASAALVVQFFGLMAIFPMMMERP